MKKILVLIIAMAAFGFVAQAQDDEAWKVTGFRMMPTDLDARVEFPVMDPNGKLCALIKIETPYPGFTFDTGTLQVMKAEQKTGEWWVYVQKGVRKITIGHARGILREWAFPEAIKEGTVYVMKLKEGTSGEATYSTAVAATAATSGFAIITSEPSGADVYIDDQWVGVTPFNKRYQMNTRLRVRCSKKMYHDDLSLVTIIDVQNKQHFNLTPAYGALHLSSEPLGANVFIDGEDSPRGVTPLTINELASGAVQVMLVKDLYAPIKQIVGIEDSRTTDYFVKLVPMYADITINTVRGATIKIDGVERGQSTFKGQLSEGLHEVEAVLASHKTVKQQIDVVAGLPMTYNLNPIPMYGTLVVNSEPFDADVYIGGKSYGKTPIIIPDMLIGDYNAEVRKSGYVAAKEHVVINEGDEIELSLTLKKKELVDKIFSVNGVQFKMIAVKGGTFQMGASSEPSFEEKPIHSVTLSNYMIGQTEVTQDLWATVMGNNPSFINRSQYPVDQVSWDDCQTFIKKLNSLTGQNFRLPTEAEWEYAAKGGNKSRNYIFSGSNDLHAVAWHRYNASGFSNPVAQKQANELGLYDMSGNVWEWCNDYWYESYSDSSQVNPQGPSSGSSRVKRGGSADDLYWFHTTCRDGAEPNYASSHIGLRLVLSE